MTQGADHPAVQHLQAFFREMNCWEIEARSQYKSFDWENSTDDQWNQVHLAARRRLEEIFEQYCEVGRQAERLQDQGIAVGDPPAYDPAREDILSVTEATEKVVIETREHLRSGWRKKYELVQCDGMWRIRDNPKRCSDKNPKWRPDML